MDYVNARTCISKLEEDLQNMRSARDKLAGITEY